MSELTYEQAAVLCRVEGMPIEYRLPTGKVWRKDSGVGPDNNTLEYHHRLTPGAELTPKQADICRGMGIAVYREHTLMCWLVLEDGGGG